MKKILLALAAMVLISTSALAGVSVMWATSGGFTHEETDLVNGTDFLLESYDVTWQLIYAGADNAIDPIDLANSANGWVSDDDDVWATRTLSQSIAQGNVTAAEDGTVWDYMMTSVSGTTSYTDLGWNTAGYVYQRVFEGAPAALSWFYESSLTALNTGYTGSPQLPQEFFIDTASSAFQPDQQIPAVPEPATMTLLGLGALAMAIRRRRA